MKLALLAAWCRLFGHRHTFLGVFYGVNAYSRCSRCREPYRCR